MGALSQGFAVCLCYRLGAIRIGGDLAKPLIDRFTVLNITIDYIQAFFELARNTLISSQASRTIPL